ncbi:putative N-acetylmuramoyl-L-alanine amidase [Clostridium bornimense]|uniref:Putative N-acetylmuramoyl-L-alanine amidase n=1 Tax=Clostridium bornimense TaxID=1216932 RepID=W6RZK6_9CLOT|nr:N-acetylmuramoyl-L-alanine amidase [Clostridium bornimense]CDM69049.1 putative N-acetylmuramoyl-L-alanine amidase [Clostridium bornimense]
MSRKSKLSAKEQKKRRIRRRVTIRLTVLFFAIIGVISTFNFIFQQGKNFVTYVFSEEEVENAEDIALASVDDDKFTICIDPGHGSHDEGTKSASGVKEKDINLKVALKLGKMLEKEDVKVIYTRKSDNLSWTGDEIEDLKERVNISNRAKSDVFISIHCNGGEDETYNGIETWCRYPNTDGAKLAELVQAKLNALNYSPGRGIKYESDGELAVLKNNNAAAILVEIGFLTNSDDLEYLKSSIGQENIAAAIADSVMEYKQENFDNDTESE